MDKDEVKSAVNEAKNRSTHPDRLVELAQHASARVRRWVAKSAFTPFETIGGLTADRSASVRAEAARHPLLPEKRLVEMSCDKASTVRGAVCAHPSTPVATVRKVAKSDHTRHVVWSIMHRMDPIPGDIAEDLLQVDEGWIRRQILRQAEFTEDQYSELAASPSANVRAGIAGSQHASQALLATLSRDADSDVVMQVAGNDRTPPRDLARLAHMADGDFHNTLGRNPSVPADSLLHLAQIVGGANVWGLTRNPSIPTSALVVLLDRFGHLEYHANEIRGELEERGADAGELLRIARRGEGQTEPEVSIRDEIDLEREMEAEPFTPAPPPPPPAPAVVATSSRAHSLGSEPVFRMNRRA